MKLEIEIKNGKVNISWEDIKADFYRVFVKKDETFYLCTTLKEIYTTLSLLPMGVTECYVDAVKNGAVIGKTKITPIEINYLDGVCVNSNDETTVICSETFEAMGYRLYKAVDETGFHGSKNSPFNYITIDSQKAKYKMKPFKTINSERVILSSTSELSAEDNKFENLTIYKSYLENSMFLSWQYVGKADGFWVYQQNSKTPIFETNDGLSHYAYLNNYNEQTKFYVQAFLNTPNGKVVVAQSQLAGLSIRKYYKPEVSVIIPAYNSKDYIARSIDSALASNFDDLEIIIVNDGSTDDTQKIIDWYAANYPNIVSLQKENGGVADARNFGIKEAKGKYIAFLDNDDMLRPNMITELYNTIVKNNCDIAIAPLYRLIDKGYTTHCTLPFEPDKAIDIDDYFEILYTPGYYNCAIWNKLYKAEIVKAHPLGILRYEDVSWTPCILSYAKNFCFINTPLYEWDRKTRPETFGDYLAKKPDMELLEHRKQAMMFFVENGNPEKSDTLKTIAIRRLLRYSKNAFHSGYQELINQLSK